MSKLLGNIDWNTVEDIGFNPLPNGVYGAKITKADMANNKAGTGKYIKLELSLLGGKGVKGRKVFEYLSVQHPNEKVVMIALGKLKKLVKSIGKNPDELEDTQELVNEMVGVKLKIENDPKYGPKNKVVDFEEFNEDLLTRDNSGDSF